VLRGAATSREQKRNSIRTERTTLADSAHSIILVGVLLTALQLSHGCTFGWLGTLAIWLSFILGEFLFRKTIPWFAKKVRS
jgi:hypothetical protein